MSQAADIAQIMDRIMRAVHAGLSTKAPAVDVEKVGPIGGMVLMALRDIEPAPVLTLGREVGRDKSQMTRLVHVLEDKGLVQRSGSETDKRVQLLGLTEKGRAQVDAFQSVLTEIIDDVLGPLDGKERQTLLALLQKV